MKKILVIFTLLAFLTINHFAEEVKKYGAEITLEQKTAISDILADAESFVGKKVLVEGTVVGVCAKRGCWMDISGDKDFEKIKIKVNDGEIVFPMEAKGKKALIEGEVYSIVTEGEDCGGDCGDEHKGEETGSEAHKGEDHKCEHEKTTKKVYLIKGLGAVIK